MAEAHRDEIAKLEALYAANPEGRVFTHLAEAYRKAGDLELAAQVLQQGLERHPDSASAYIVLGRVRFDRGERAEAGRAFRRALELDSGNLVAHRFLGELALEEDAPDEALHHYRELLSRNPGDAALQQRVDDLAHPAASAAPDEQPAFAGESQGEAFEPGDALEEEPLPEAAGVPEDEGQVAGESEPIEYPAYGYQPDVPAEISSSYGEIPLADTDFAATEAEADAGYREVAVPDDDVTDYGEIALPDEEPAGTTSLAFEAEAPTDGGVGPEAERPFSEASFPLGEGDEAGAFDSFPDESDDALSGELPLLDLALDQPADDLATLEPGGEAYAELARADYGFGGSEPIEEEFRNDYGTELGAGGEPDVLGDPAAGTSEGSSEEPAGDIGITDLDVAFPAAAEGGAGFEDERAAETTLLEEEEEERAAEQDRLPPDDPALSDAGLVTETMAELYRTQGFHARAADVYRSLLRERSEDERLRERLAEVETEMASASARHRREPPDPESVESAFTGGGGAAGDQDTPYAWSAPDDATQGIAIGEYFRSLLSWRPGSETSRDAGMPGAAWRPDAAAGWAGEELTLEAIVQPDEETGWTPEALDVDTGPEAALMGGELLLEPAEPMPWTEVPASEARLAEEPPAPSSASGDLMPWELPELPGLEPAAAETGQWAEPVTKAGPAPTPEVGEAASEDESEDEDEDLEMFRSWLQSLKK